MEENLYAIVDKQAGIALKPFITSRNDVDPIRQVQQLANDDKTIINAHSRDFVLIHFATVNLETLDIKPVEPRTVAEAVDLVAIKP
jgi:hypothetical protein